MIVSMSDEEFIRDFEACTLPAERFHHQEHVRVVWLYLLRYSVLETLARFSEYLKRFAAANGQATLYHETISWAYVFLIHERMARHVGTPDLAGIHGDEQGSVRLADQHSQIVLPGWDTQIRTGAEDICLAGSIRT